MKRVIVKLLGFGFVFMLLSGCSANGHNNLLSEYHTPQEEADWIIEGRPIEFEGELWFPQDNVDILLDSEVSLVGEYKGVQFFVEKIDVRPYDRLYTKFGRNKFRAFTKRSLNDKGQKSL